VSRHVTRSNAGRSGAGHPDTGQSDAGFTLVELMIALAIFSLLLATVCASLFNVQDQTTNNLSIQELMQSGMLALNEVATEVRDLSNSYDNSVQTNDGGDADIVTMNATQLQFLVGNNIVKNDAAGLVDTSGGSFTTGCANELNISLSSGNLVQNQTVPTLSNGQCTWTSAAGSATLLRNIEPLCSGSPCAAGTPGATIFSYWERYPDQTTTATTATQVGEITIGFAVVPQQNSSQITPVVLTQTVRLAAVLDDPSS
jgi:prepilin-type N-terminal cleavage/methylation domain-containing protein